MYYDESWPRQAWFKHYVLCESWPGQTWFKHYLLWWIMTWSRLSQTLCTSVNHNLVKLIQTLCTVLNHDVVTPDSISMYCCDLATSDSISVHYDESWTGHFWFNLYVLWWIVTLSCLSQSLCIVLTYDLVPTVSTSIFCADLWPCHDWVNLYLLCWLMTWSRLSQSLCVVVIRDIFTTHFYKCKAVQNTQCTCQDCSQSAKNILQRRSLLSDMRAQPWLRETSIKKKPCGTRDYLLTVAFLEEPHLSVLLEHRKLKAQEYGDTGHQQTLLSVVLTAWFRYSTRHGILYISVSQP